MRRALFAFVLFCVFAPLTQAADINPPVSGLYGLPAMPLQNADTLGSLAGQPTILVLFQPHCPWCRLQFKESNKVLAQHPKAQIVAIALWGSRRQLLRELRKDRAQLPAYLASPALIKALGDPRGTPRSYVISADGKLLVQGRGLQKADKLTMVLNALEK